MSSTIQIKNGRVIDPANELDQTLSVFIVDDRILSVGDSTPPNFQPEQIIDAENCIVCPGLVDLSARLREPGAEHKATIHSESLAAAKAGITTVCLPPDTDPVIDEPAVVELIQKRAQQQHAARIVTLGALTAGLQGQQLTEVAALKDAGCVGVSNALHPMQDSKVLRRAMEYASTFDLTLHVVPLDNALAANGNAHEGDVSTQLGLQGIPVSAETVALAQHLALIEETGMRTHFCRISSARAVAMITEAKSRGLPITADVAIHQLLLNEYAIAQFDSRAHVVPPLRTESDRQALLNALQDGIIDAICSDHQPHEADAKLNPYPQTAAGISGVDTLLSLSLSLQNAINLPAIIKALTQAPADILQTEFGSLSKNARADVCIFDPKAEWMVDQNNISSSGKNTPFMGQTLAGKVRTVIIDGKVVD